MKKLSNKKIKQALFKRSLLTLQDYSKEEILYLLKLAKKLKEEKISGKKTNYFYGKNLALIFEKRSTRTRCAFETAFSEDGGHPVFLSTSDIQLGQKESIEDTAKVLGSMFDAIEFRGFSQESVEVLARESGVPVYNGLTDEFHPTQVLADIMTMQEAFGSVEGRKMVFVGDGRNNVANSLMIGCAKVGINFTIVAPAELHPSSNLVELASKIASSSGAKIEITSDIESGVKGADVIYTDVWASMGEESQSLEREELLKNYQVNSELMKKSGKNSTIFMHCLPAIKGKEVTREVFDSDASWVFEEAENRKWTIKAIMVATLCK